MNVDGFINKLNLCCREKGLTRTRWANEFGISEATIRNWIRRNTMPSADIVVRIAKYFGVPVEYLIDDTEPSLADVDFLMLLKFKKLSDEKKNIALALIDALLKETPLDNQEEPLV